MAVETHTSLLSHIADAGGDTLELPKHVAHGSSHLEKRKSGCHLNTHEYPRAKT